MASLAHKFAKKQSFKNVDNADNKERFQQYARSKLANLLFSFGLTQRLEKANVAPSKLLVCSAHPGYTSTALQSKGTTFEKGLFVVANAVMAQAPKYGAMPTLRAATDPQAKPNGYFGPRGMGEMTGYPTDKAYRTALATDTELGDWLWDYSVDVAKGAGAVDINSVLAECASSEKK